jgi:PhnB protein
LKLAKEEISMTPDSQTITNHKTSISPMLSVRHGAKAIEFYKTAFGAGELFRIENDGAVVAQLSVGTAEFWLADEAPAYQNFSPESLAADSVSRSSVRMVMVVDDPDAVFARAVKAGATVVQPVTDQPYGWRVGRVVDPFGHHWEIGKPL